MRRRTIPSAFVLGLVAVLGCEAPPLAGGGEAARAEADPLPARAEFVQTARAQQGEIRSVITTSGSVVARRSTPIGPAIAGRILHIFVHVGDEVRLGSPLFQIDPEPYAIAQREAEAGRALARAELGEALEEASRQAELADKQIVSSQEERRARTRAAVARARLKQVEARVSSVEADVRRTLVLAPYAGSIVERSAHEGIMATVRPNTTIVVLQESGALEAVLDVPESVQVAVHVKDRVRLWVEGQVEPLESEVSSVKREIDRGTRTYAVRVPVNDPSGTIKSGAFVRAEIESQPRENALLVDPSAVTRQEGSTFVLRVREGKVEQRRVRLGIDRPDAIEILDGLAEHDQVVIGEAASRLMEGTPVRTADVAAAPKRAPQVSAEPRAEETTP